jgi:toluene monooxygenase system protein E
MSAADDLSKPLRTWSHLAANRRRPTEYEIVSTRILWNTPNHTVPWKMAGSTKPIQWIIKNRNGSLLQHPEWDAFRDPDQLVYRTYTLMQDGQERYVDGILNDYNKNDHDAGLAADWVDMLASLYAPARFPIHAIQMGSGYLVALAPSSTVANCFMFQCGDQLRWVSRIAYRTAELAAQHPDHGFGSNERGHWERGAAWRGFVELAERALIAWDWGECFTALNLILKPALDEAFLRQFASASRHHGDTLTATLLDAQFTDSKRARRVAAAIVKFLCDAENNRGVFETWLEKWVPYGDRAIDAFCLGFDTTGEAGAAAKASAQAFRAELGFHS